MIGGPLDKAKHVIAADARFTRHEDRLELIEFSN